MTVKRITSNRVSFTAFIVEIENMEYDFSCLEKTCPELEFAFKSSTIKNFSGIVKGNQKKIKAAEKYIKNYSRYLNYKLTLLNILKISRMQIENDYAFGEYGKKCIDQMIMSYGFPVKKIKSLIESAAVTLSIDEIRERIIHYSFHIPGGRASIIEHDKINCLLQQFMSEYSLQTFSFSSLGYEYIYGVWEERRINGKMIQIAHQEILTSPGMNNMVTCGSSSSIIFLRKEAILNILNNHTLYDLKNISEGYFFSSPKFNVQLLAAYYYKRININTSRITDLYSEQILDHQVSAQVLYGYFDNNQNMMLSIFSDALLTDCVSVLKDSAAYWDLKSGPVKRILDLGDEDILLCNFFYLVTIIDTTYYFNNDNFNMNCNMVSAVLLNYIDPQGNVNVNALRNDLGGIRAFCLDELAVFLTELYIISSNITFIKEDREYSFQEMLDQIFQDKNNHLEQGTTSESRYSFNLYAKKELVQTFPGYKKIIDDEIKNFESRFVKRFYKKFAIDETCSINEYVAKKISCLDVKDIKNNFRRSIRLDY